ncbi:transcription factor mef2A isoform X1 [Drosophila mojavensis]|uniref:Uncharacterized protein, isoform D n=1 Tax=Drosophila mojavensis TaxID=7230 RepID=A0A0Q9X0A4_DROMO|nr:transcription factor mef2A isoform X1 [Drosophila mojavensis]KRF94181.1 uncharacterized protein Dmoj_GI15912, isoform D [Drosophila mojavensis]
MTTPNLYDEKEVMEEFISCYRHFTALWDNTSIDYLSKKKKAPGYQELLKILRRVNREASVQDVKRKINSLRCCYRREIRKIQSSYNGYEPRLWWFHLMDFLKPVLNLNFETTSRIKHEIKGLDDSLDEASMHDEDIFAEPFPPEEDMLVIEGEADAEGDIEGDDDGEGDGNGNGDGDGDVDNVVEAEDEENGVKHGTLSEARHKCDPKMESKYQQHSHSGNNNSNSNNNANNHNHNNNNSISGAGKHVHPHPYATVRLQPQQQQQSQSRRSMRRRQHSTDDDGDYGGESTATVSKKRRQMMMERSIEHTESECDLIGKRMAAHFRNMRPDQRLFAERIISEVLVFGRMNRLSLDARFLPNGTGGDLFSGDNFK